MSDSREQPRTGEEAAQRGLIRLRDAVLFRRNNPHRKEWENINDRNNFAPSIAETMRNWTGRPA